MSWLVLIVEDDDDIRDTMTSVLQARGYRVIAARNGRDAIAQVHARGARPSAVLLDLMMPVMDGEAFLAHQAADPLLAEVPVIIMTAQLHRPDPLPPTVQTMFDKPVRLSDVLEALYRVCSDSRAPLAHGTSRMPALDPPPELPAPAAMIVATPPPRPPTDPDDVSE